MLDMKLKKEIEKIDREVINMTPLTQEETKEKVKNEVQEETKEIEINIPRNSNNILRNHSDRIEDYIRIEKTVAELFRSN